MSVLATLYRTLTDYGAPILALYLRRRRAEGREDALRFGERLGQASRLRPEGRLIWCHAASVGEGISLLPLIEKIHEAHPDLTFLITTGTVTAAKMIAPRLPAYALHQYVPVDRTAYIEKFLSHWRPHLVLWVESELWPNILAAVQRRLIPAILLNARMSEKSFRQWHRVRFWAKEILSTFSLCMAQTEDDRGRFIALGAPSVVCAGNLKYAAEALPCDAFELKELQKNVGLRPLWLMASSHRGEDELALAAHREIVRNTPDLLTIIAPRHAGRGDEIAALAKNAQLTLARRSKGEIITPYTHVYIADTMGEMGLFYRLARIVVLGGSFVQVGGHNPIEPAQVGAAIVFGPYMYNFVEISREFLRAGAAVQLQHGNEIAFTVGRLLGAPSEVTRLGLDARLLADQKRSILDRLLLELQPWLRT